MGASDPVEILSEALRIRILPQGASLVGVRFTDDPRNLVLGFADPAEHARVPIYAGAIVGPVANRVTGGHVQIDDTPFQMACNEGGHTALHSGDDGLHTRLWRVTAVTTNAVTLTCTLPDGWGGLPGNRRFMVEYAVENTSLTVTIAAAADKPTPISLATHPYWNLDGTADVSNHRLQLHAEHLLPTDPQNLPTGDLLPVSETSFDFRTATCVPLDPNLDLNFCLADHQRDAPCPAATLTGGDGTTLRIDTNAPGLQVYNGAFLPTDAPAADDFPALAPFAGIALEPQHWPDAPNQPGFPQITLRPGDVYLQISRYTLSR